MMHKYILLISLVAFTSLEAQGGTIALEDEVNKIPFSSDSAVSTHMEIFREDFKLRYNRNLDGVNPADEGSFVKQALRLTSYEIGRGERSTITWTLRQINAQIVITL